MTSYILRNLHHLNTELWNYSDVHKFQHGNVFVVRKAITVSQRIYTTVVRQ